MNNSILTGLILMTIVVIFSTNAQFLNSEKRLEFSNWKSQHGKIYGDKAQESLR